ncbi:MAG: type IV pilus assembly protein PilM [Parcubacteria group bacterium]|nr:type IV pilus assembly protein PilM [Parcubacteria group bacterium]
MFLFGGKKSFLGIDIGTTSIKMVELEKDRVARLVTYGELVFRESDSIKLLESEMADFVRKILKESGAASKSAVMSIPLFSSFLTVVELPAMSQAELVKAIPFEAKEFIPVPIDDVVLDWQIIREKFLPNPRGPKFEPVKKIDVLLIVVPKETISRYTRIAEEAGLSLLALEVEPLSLGRLIKLIRADEKDPGLSLVLDMGERYTNISIIDKGLPVLTHSIEIAGRELTKALVQSVGISWERAEEIKREQGLSGQGGEAPLSDLLITITDRLIAELERVISDFKQKNEKKIDKIFVAGGSAALPGLSDYLNKKFSLAVVALNPFSKIDHPTVLDSALDKYGSTLSIASGLALRQIIES